MTVLKSGDLSYSSFSSVPALATGGDQTYRIRFNNSYSGQILRLSQTTSSALKKGTYKLTADWYVSNKNYGNGYIKIDDNQYDNTTSGWTTFSQSFTSSGVTHTFTLGAYHSSTNEKFYGFDNFKLEWNLTKSLTDLITEANGIYVEGCTLAGMTSMKTALDDANDNKNSTDQAVLEAKYIALADALPLASAIKTYWTAKTSGQTALSNGDYVNVVGTERTALSSSVNAEVTNTIDWFNGQATTIEGALSTFTATKTNYDLNAAEVTRATSLGVAPSTISTYTAGASTTAETALTNTQALKVAEYSYVTDNYTEALTLGDWTPSTVKEENTNNWDGTSGYYKSSNGYSSASWNCSFSQTLDLPAGVYIFKVAGRRSSNSSMRIEVKSGETELGKENDFPKASSGLGINTSGAADFTTGDGHTYANSGNGYGWEWRYVKFTLAEKTTVTVAIKGSAGVSSQWINFSGYQVLTDNAVNVSFYEYYKSLNQATAARDNATYTNVQGTDRSNLVAAINADPGSTTSSIGDAKSAIDDAYSTFTAGVESWNGYALVKGYCDAAASLAYATTAKKEAVTTAKNATINTAADALAQTATINTANRVAYESHALAEGVTSAVVQTALISDPNMDVTYDGTNKKFGAWQVFGQTDGTIKLKDDTESLTDGDGNATYKYADIWKSDNNAGIKQTLSSLPAGKYMLTVSARADDTAGATFWIFAGDNSNNISRLDNKGGVFGRGWNDASVEFTITTTSNVDIGVQSGNGKDLWWSATRFRLVQLPTPEVTIKESDASVPDAYALANVTLTRTLSASYWNSFSVPFDAAIPSGWTVKEYDSENSADNVIAFKDATSLVAGVPYLVKPSADAVNPTFNNVVVQATEGTTIGEGDYKFAAQIYNKSLPIDGTIAYLATDGKIKKLNSATGLKGLRAYFIIPAGSGDARISFGGEETGIISIDNGKMTMDNAIYDMQGRRIETMKKGVYVVNGKKVIKK